MTWQIGFHADITKRNLSEQEVLSRAKKNLSNFYFVGIYEQITKDYNAIVKKLNMSPEILPQMKITKYRKQVSDLSHDNNRLILERNQLDYDLYEFLKNKLKKE
jgi:hypothetical protein